MQQHDIVETSLATFARELELKVLDGWTISKSNPGEVVGLYGGSFTVSLERSNETIQRLHSMTEKVKEAPKADRGTILAKARQAKAAKKATGNS